MDTAYLDEWLNLVARWAHVVIAMTWIGTSIYFMRLDGSLRKPKPREDGWDTPHGELWSSHGGGTYYTQKYLVPPRGAPPDVHFATPWPAWGTWLSGLVLMIVLYYWNADSYLIDRSVRDLTQAEAIVLSLAIIVGGWLVYDAVCRLLRNDRAIALGAFGLICLAAWISSELFSSRATWVETGALMGTMMSANVAFVINPTNQKLIVDRAAGREPDVRRGLRAKQRSTHNSYLTLPVVIAMIGNHFPGVYGAGTGWLAIVALGVVGALVRHFFIVWHSGRRLWWILPAAAVALGVIAFGYAPDTSSSSASGTAAAPPTQAQLAAGRKLFQTVGCAGCHTLADAGAKGNVGPDLDAAKPSRDLVVQRITDGMGVMPSFKDRLSDQQIATLAAYVSSVAGKR